MKNVLLILFVIYGNVLLSQQVLETKQWCVLECEITPKDLRNIDLIHLQMKNDSIKNAINSKKTLRFPLRIGIVQTDTTKVEIDEIDVRKAIDNLNQSFEPVGFSFYIAAVDLIISSMSLEDLSQNAFNIYDEFSKTYDKSDMISLYILDHKNDFCKVANGGVSCGRTGGFSYILSERANNVVMSRFDLLDAKIIAHEFGHFFGLYHTFEEGFGKDNFEANQCHILGDRICDTPPDPGAVFEVHVNYSICEMIGWKNEKGMEYKPLIENYMSYYKPCYLKKYSFTPDQISVMKIAGWSDMRKRFSQ